MQELISASFFLFMSGKVAGSAIRLLRKPTDRNDAELKDIKMRGGGSNTIHSDTPNFLANKNKKTSIDRTQWMFF